MSGLDAVTLPVSFSTNMNETEFPCDAVAVVEVPPPSRRPFNMQLPCICAADVCLLTNQIILARLFLITPGGKKTKTKQNKKKTA